MKTKKQNWLITRLLMIQLTGMILFGILFLIPFSSGAQVIYVDINPDTTIATDSGFYNLDMNIDGISDFQIILSSLTSFPNIKINVLNDSSYFAFFHIDGCYMAWRFELNDSINSITPWSNYPGGGILAQTGPTYCMHSGAFIGQTDKYLGLKLIKNGIIYFGWVRIDVASDATWFTLKDYAYSPSELLAGQTATRIDHNYTNTTEIKVFENESEIIVKPITYQKLITGLMTNSLSQVNQISVNNNEIRIVKSMYKPGLYFLTLKTTLGKYSIKILIK